MCIRLFYLLPSPCILSGPAGRRKAERGGESWVQGASLFSRAILRNIGFAVVVSWSLARSPAVSISLNGLSKRRKKSARGCVFLRVSCTRMTSMCWSPTRRRSSSWTRSSRLSRYTSKIVGAGRHDDSFCRRAKDAGKVGPTLSNGRHTCRTCARVVTSDVRVSQAARGNTYLYSEDTDSSRAFLRLPGRGW